MHNNQIITILGRKGSGKTYLARYLCQSAKRLVVYDPRGNFSKCGLVVDNKNDFIRYLEQQQNKNFRIIYQPKFLLGQDRSVSEEHFNFVGRCIGRLKNILFVIDEVHLFSNQKENGNMLKDFIVMGRQVGISIISTTIRYTNVTTDMRNNSDVLISFQCQEPSDVDYLRKRFGNLADELPTLPSYHFIMKRSDSPTATKERPV